MVDIKKLPELNPECFTFENYEACWWGLLDLDFSDSLTVSNVMPFFCNGVQIRRLFFQKYNSYIKKSFQMMEII